MIVELYFGWHLQFVSRLHERFRQQKRKRKPSKSCRLPWLLGCHKLNSINTVFQGVKASQALSAVASVFDKSFLNGGSLYYKSFTAVINSVP